MVMLPPRIVHAIGRKAFGQVILVFERIRGTWLRGDEHGYLLRLLVGQASRSEIRHRVPDNAGQREAASRAGAVVPRIGAPERPWFLVADHHALSVRAMARRAAFVENRFPPR